VIGAALLAAAVGVGLLFALPAIDEGKRDRASAEQ
jgi:hypothetical protein